jgi:hypothetical protein
LDWLGLTRAADLLATLTSAFEIERGGDGDEWPKPMSEPSGANWRAFDLTTLPAGTAANLPVTGSVSRTFSIARGFFHGPVNAKNQIPRTKFQDTMGFDSWNLVLGI